MCLDSSTGGARELFAGHCETPERLPPAWMPARPAFSLSLFAVVNQQPARGRMRAYEQRCEVDGRDGRSTARCGSRGLYPSERTIRQHGSASRQYRRSPAVDRGAPAGSPVSGASRRPAPVILPLLIPTLGVQDLVLALVAVLVLFWLVYRALLAVIERPNRR